MARRLGTTDPIQRHHFTVEETEAQLLQREGEGLSPSPVVKLMAECQDGHHK